MEDAWDDLGEVYHNSKSKLIGEIDCTAEEAKELCQEHGVQSYPTLKFGDVYDLQEYEGPRDYESLKKFSDKQLKPICGVNHVQLCDKATRKEIRRLKKLSLEELNEEILVQTTKMTAIEAYAKDFIEALEEKYETAMKEKETASKEITESGLALMKGVAAERGIPIEKKSKESEEDEDEFDGHDEF